MEIDDEFEFRSLVPERDQAWRPSVMARSKREASHVPLTKIGSVRSDSELVGSSSLRHVCLVVDSMSVRGRGRRVFLKLLREREGEQAPDPLY